MSARIGMFEGTIRSSRHSTCSRGLARKEVWPGERRACFSRENTDGRLGLRMVILRLSKVEVHFLGGSRIPAVNQGAVASHSQRTRKRRNRWSARIPPERGERTGLLGRKLRGLDDYEKRRWLLIGRAVEGVMNGSTVLEAMQEILLIS